MAAKILYARKRKGSLVRDRGLLDEKRAKIAAVALALFVRDGFHGATTRAIARQARMSTGALFTYFRDKEEILLHIITHQQEQAEVRMVEALRRQLAEAADGVADAITVFSAVFDAFMYAVNELRHFILLAYQETKSLDRAAKEALKERERRVQGILIEAIRYGVRQGRFSPGDLELKAHSVMMLGHAWALRRWAFVGVSESIDDYIRFLKPQVLAMLKTKAATANRARSRYQTANGGASGKPQYDDNGKDETIRREATVRPEEA